MTGIRHIERFNCGTLRRYHLNNGIMAVCSKSRRASFIPRWCPMVGVPVSRQAAATELRRVCRAGQAHYKPKDVSND